MLSLLIGSFGRYSSQFTVQKDGKYYHISLLHLCFEHWWKRLFWTVGRPSWPGLISQLWAPLQFLGFYIRRLGWQESDGLSERSLFQVTGLV